jgi:gamma-glutamylcyclotransferase
MSSTMSTATAMMSAASAPVQPRRRDDRRRVRVFAYGSNLHPGQIRERCPSARTLFRAGLPGHGLAFVGFSATWLGPVANVARHATRLVPGVVYEISRGDLKALDRFEGVPFAYERTLRRVVDESGDAHVVHVYLQRSASRPAAPSEAYLRQIMRGYLHHGIELARLFAAMGLRPPRALRSAAAAPRPGPRRQKRQRSQSDLRKPNPDA